VKNQDFKYLEFPCLYLILQQVIVVSVRESFVGM